MGDVGLGHGPGGDGLFEESAEDETATTRGAAVEPEGELLEVGLEGVGGDGALRYAGSRAPLRGSWAS